MRVFRQLMITGVTAMLSLSVQAAQPPSTDDLIKQFGGKDPTAAPERGFKFAPASTAPVVRSPYRPVSATRERPVQVEPSSSPPLPPAGPREVNLNVTFRTGSADLTPAAVRYLDPLGGAINSADLINSRFRIEGNTDNVGNPEDNLLLSKLRAQKVVAYLIETFKVDPSRLEAVGLGDTVPVVDTPPQTPNEPNRRVHIVRLPPT